MGCKSHPNSGLPRKAICSHLARPHVLRRFSALLVNWRNINLRNNIPATCARVVVWVKNRGKALLLLTYCADPPYCVRSMSASRGGESSHVIQADVWV